MSSASVAVGTVAVLDGRSCQLLARWLRTVTPALAAAGRLDAIAPAIRAVDQAASAQRELDRQGFDVGVTSDWLTVAQAASRFGCSEQNVRARLARGTIPGERKGRAWRVAPQLPQLSA